MEEKITKLETENQNLISEKTELAGLSQKLLDEHQQLKVDHEEALEDIRQRKEWKRKYNNRQRNGANY